MKQLAPNRCRANLFNRFLQGNGTSVSYSWLFIAMLLSFTNLNLSAQGFDLEELTSSDGESVDNYGYAVSLSDDHMVVGAIFNDWNGSNSGAVYVYEKDGLGNWVNEQKLGPSDGDGVGQYGHSVGISGDYLVVGSPYDDENGYGSGSIYIYKKDATGTWGDEQKITPSDAYFSDWFGLSVSISGDYLVAGASRNSDNGVSSGSAYVYENDGTGIWGNEQKITASDASENSFFGGTVYMSDNQLFVSAQGANDAAGTVYVYQNDGSGNWGDEQKITASDASPSSYFGSSIASFGDQLVIGAMLADGNDNGSGAVYFYEKDASGDWNFEQKLIASDGEYYDYYGQSLSISADLLVIGAPQDVYESDPGAVYVYENDGTGSWGNEQKIMVDGVTTANRFGHSVSISDGKLILGTPGEIFVNPSPVGSVYIATPALACTLEISCPADQTINAVQGTCEGPINFVDPTMTTSDATLCNPVLTQTTGPANGTVATAGVHVLSFEASDDAGNLETCSFTIDIVDSTLPISICQDFTIALDNNGAAIVLPEDVDNGSNDECGIAALSLSQTDYDCTHLGPNTVTLTVTDANNNESTCDAIVTVEDNVAAEALCQDLTVQLDNTGNVSITASDLDNGSNDACGIASLELSLTAFDCSVIGENTVTLTVTDNNTNVSTCDAIVTVEDNIAPEALCQDFTVQLDNAGNGSTIAAAVDNGSNDACGIANLELSLTDFDCTVIGENTVILTVTDNNANESTCDAVVTVVDNVNPVITCPANLVFDLCSANDVDLSTVGTATVTDNCQATIDVSVNQIPGICLASNIIERTFTATDIVGNTSSCVQTITTQDLEAPVITVNDITVNTDQGVCGAVVSFSSSATDNCSSASITYSIPSGSFFPVGTTLVTVTATDLCENSSSVVFEVVVIDDVAPVALCQDVVVELDASGNGSTTATAVDNGSNDLCGIATLELSKTDFDCTNVGPNPVTLTATDENNNVSTCDAVVTVEDNIASIMTCPDVTINLDPGFCGANVTYEVTATDNCGVASNALVSGPASGDYLDYHDSSWDVVWEAIDVNGNATQCAFTIEMFEYANPTETLTCNDNVQISLDQAGTGILGADMILEGGPYGCYDDYIVTIDGASNGLDCSMIGAGSIMVMVEDPETGNTCWSNIIVEDKIGPDCVTVSDYTVDCEEGLPADTDPVYWPTFGDNCAVAEVNLVSETVLNSDICTDITVERVWTAVDASGNTANTNCVQTITITRGSILLPTDIDFDCTNYTLEDLVPALTGFPEGGATSCGYSYTYTDAVFDGCGNTAAITRTWSILDECSSAVTTHVQLISLIDIQGPSITYNDITVSANVTAAHPQPCLSTAIIPTNAAVSDCSDVVSVRYFTSVGEVINGSIPAPGLPIGEHTLTITAEDACGNTSSEDFTITVIDGIAPTPVCKEITQISLSTDGTAVVPAESFDNGSYDNCCLDYIEVRRMDETTYGPTVSFDCTDETVEVVLRAVDCYENDNTCMVVALVEDKLAPTCTAPADVTGVDCDVYYSELAAALANEDYSVLEVYGQGTTADNCTLVSDYTVSYDVDECGNGTITRTWTANDAAENQTAVCKQDIFIVHNSNWTVAFSAVDQVEVECADAEIEELAPVITNDACEMIATSYTDTQFEVVGSDHCMKIFRDWTVINWCAYDSENEVSFPQNDATPLTGDISGSGYATYTQVIKVVDNTAPEVTTNDALVVSEDADACTTDIAVADVEALFGLDSNCGDVEDYHNFGDLDPYLNDAGTTFVGVPAGTYEVSRTSVDACGNAGTAVNTVTVEPKAPTAYCTDELVIDLMVTGMAEVNAVDFNFASSDNCTATGDLSYAFSSDIENTVMTVTCDNLGANTVEMWVFDADGQTDFCVVTLTVQNNNGADCGTGTLTVSGAIHTEDADAVSEVEVEVNGGLFATSTDADGLFTFDLAQGGDYTVAPSYDVNVANGVTTFDIVKITRHILGIESLDSAYKVIAADANNSASVTTLDIVSIRKVILQIEDAFSNNTSWRFVDAAYTFADPMNPWGFAEVVNINNLEADALSTDFVAVKVGDVTGDAQTSFGSADDRTKNGAFAIDAKEVAMTAGNTYEVTFTADTAVEGFQFTMNFDAKKVAFVGLTEGVATAENFGFAKLNEGAITASWNADAAYDFAGAEVFTVSFTALEDVNLSEAVSINSRFTAAEAYAAGELQDVALTFSGSTTANYALYQNTPNPFKGETVIAFELAEAGNAVVTIMDVNGKVVRTINGDFAKGFNNVTVKDINTTGVLYYTLESGDFTATKKMIIIE
jgi:hypothetical protein